MFCLNAQIGEEDSVLVFLILFVVDAGGDFLGAQFFGQDRRHDVDILFGVRVYGYEKIRIPDTRLDQSVYGRGYPLHGDDVGLSADSLQTLLIGAYHGDVMVFHAQHLGQVAAYLPGSGYDDLHIWRLPVSALSASDDAFEKLHCPIGDSERWIV